MKYQNRLTGDWGEWFWCMNCQRVWSAASWESDYFEYCPGIGYDDCNADGNEAYVWTDVHTLILGEPTSAWLVSEEEYFNLLV